MNDATSTAPPGWYPDPAGQPQWRVWNGAGWSDAVRPYDPDPSRHVESPGLDSAGLSVIASLLRLARLGVLAYYAGFALVVGVMTHWPSGAHPGALRVSSVVMGAGLGMALVGSVAFAVCVRSLRGRWTIDAVIPIVNTFAASYWMSRRLGGRGFEFRLYADVVITLGFVLLCGSQPWVGIALAGVAVTQLARVFVVLDQLSGPPRPPTSAAAS